MKALKEKIEEDRGNNGFPAVGQKLIYAGEPENNFDRGPVQTGDQEPSLEEACLTQQLISLSPSLQSP